MSGNTRPSSGTHGTAAASIQGTGDAMSISSVIPEAPQSKHSKKARSKKDTQRIPPTSTKATDPSEAVKKRVKRERVEKTRMARADTLRKQFPTMQNIPNSITPSKRKKLIALHKQNATDTSTLRPTHSARTQSPEDVGQEKQRHRATLLRQQYPNMTGIPPMISKKIRRRLIAQYEANSTAPAPSATMPTSSGTAAQHGLHPNGLPTRPVPPNSTSGTHATRQTTHETSAASSANFDSRSQRPTSHKMAPLSEERRAEVARNLAAGSNDDPVMID